MSLVNIGYIILYLRIMANVLYILPTYSRSRIMVTIFVLTRFMAEEQKNVQTLLTESEDLNELNEQRG